MKKINRIFHFLIAFMAVTGFNYHFADEHSFNRSQHVKELFAKLEQNVNKRFDISSEIFYSRNQINLQRQRAGFSTEVLGRIETCNELEEKLIKHEEEYKKLKDLFKEQRNQIEFKHQYELGEISPGEIEGFIKQKNRVKHFSKLIFQYK